MTSSELTSTVRTPPNGDRVPDVVATVTGALPVVVTVTAVVVTRGNSPYLAETLAALRAQSVAPDSVVVVDTATNSATGHYRDLHLGDARFLPAPRARSFGEAVDAALAEGDSGTWLWLLHDDAAPAPDALAELLGAVEHSTAVAVAGPKQQRWEPGTAPDGGAGRLIEVGYTVTPLGRRMTGIDEHEIDQGQHDAREDVLAVGLAGALVRRSVWDALGGTDPELGAFGDGLDLCRRARLAGHRVVVVPTAVVRHAQASLLGLRDRPVDTQPVRGPGRAARRARAAHLGDVESSYGARRRSHLHLRLVSVPAPALPLVVIAMLVGAPFHAMYRLLVKQPGHARSELVAPVWALLRAPAVARARRKARRTRRLPRRTLRPLRGTWRDVVAERRDRRLARAEQRRTAWAPTDIERAELRALAVRRRVALSGVVVALAGLTAVCFGPLVGTLGAGGRLVGGALLPASSTVGDVWRAATNGWVATGLGAPAPADPFVGALLPAALLFGGSAQTAVNVLVPASLLVAGLGAWFAAGAVTRSIALRAWATLVWAGAPVLLTAVGSGRVGTVLAHATLPWVALALVRALGRQRVDVVAPPTEGTVRPRRPEPGSLAAAAAAGLALAVAVAGAPVLLPAALVVLLVLAATVRRHLRYLALVPVPALVLFAPFVVHVVRTWSDGGWRLLLAEPGAASAAPGAPAAAWQQLLGQPVEPAPWFGLDGAGVLDVLARWAPFAAGVAVVLLAAAAVVRGRRGAASAWFVAAVGLAAAVLAGTSGGPSGWSGPGISLTLLALLAAALLGAPRLGGRSAPAWRTGSVVALAVVVTLLPLGALASWTADVLDRTDARVGALRAADGPVVPPVGQQMQTSPRQVRVLALEPGADGVVGYAAMRADGLQLVDSSSVAHAWSLADPGAVQAGLPELVAELSAGAADDVAARLARLGVGAVLVPASAAETQGRAELVARLDMVAGLERTTEGRAEVVWRVAPEGGEPTWAWIESAGTTEGLDSTMASARPVDVRVAAGDADRVVVLAENAASGWRATLDGRALPAVDPARTGGLQAFELGADAGALEIYYATDHRTGWLAAAGVVLVVYVLLAVPVRRRRAGAR